MTYISGTSDHILTDGFIYKQMLYDISAPGLFLPEQRNLINPWNAAQYTWEMTILKTVLSYNAYLA